MIAEPTPSKVEASDWDIGLPWHRLGTLADSAALPSPRVRIALVDDEEGMHNLLRKTFKKFARAWTLDSYRNGRHALARIPKSPPDAVLMDIRMPGVTGVDCARRLKNRLPNLPIIMLSGHVDPEILLNSMMAGASGCLCKPASAPEIVLALKKMMAGALIFCPRAEKTLLDCFHLLGKDCNGWDLTSREHDIMICICQQKSDKQIAADLGIGTGTVHGHIASIYKKLDVHGRPEAIRKILSVNRGQSNPHPFKLA